MHAPKLRMDAHQHYWSISRGDYGWITPEIPRLYRDYLPEDLAPSLAKHRLDGTIVVQAAPTVEETDYLFALAEREPSILGVVGWLDLHDMEHRRHLERYAGHPKFVGIRTMIQDMPDAYAILEPQYVEALRELAERDLPVDLLVKSDQLDALAQLLERVPNLRGVVDHIAKPRIATGEIEPWLSSMRDIARHPKLHCKLSGMVTEADHASWQPDHFTSYVQHVISLFGRDRILFGSDWPVCLLAAEYDEVIGVLTAALPEDWTDEDNAKLFGGNAQSFYKLQTG
jgi:L-fuconolactonase